MYWIKKIQVRGLWGRYDVSWTIADSVSVLAGGNGSGKSTILRAFSAFMIDGRLDELSADLIESITVEMSDGAILSSEKGFDPASMPYRVRSNVWGDAGELRATDAEFCDFVDAMFEESSKRVVRGSDPLEVELWSGKRLEYSKLSSGEREILRLLWMAHDSRKGDILVLDEPEISLHCDWQTTLLEDLQGLADGQIQMFVSTHSPAIVMNGWLANVVELGGMLHIGER